MAKIFLLCEPVYDSEWGDLIGYREPYFASFSQEIVIKRAMDDTLQDLKESNIKNKPAKLVSGLDEFKNEYFGFWVGYYTTENKLNNRHVCSILEVEVEDAPNI